MDREEHVCRVCGQPVETVVKRHKTLGAWVPVWVPGPCRNPDCSAYVEPGRAADSGRPADSGRSAESGRPESGRPEDPSSAGAREPSENR
ncbi:hypothetical protein ACFY71_28255 [Streptomyces cinerochromogenes]|uniref:hypothetical protein n=1 Tax=Streptomyces cinerochromogenes TaxID=66422 RepID=UPI0036A66AB2